MGNDNQTASIIRAPLLRRVLFSCICPTLIIIPIAFIVVPLTFFALLHLSGQYDPHANDLGYGLAAVFSLQLTAIIYSAAQLIAVPLLLLTRRFKNRELLVLGLQTELPLFALCAIAGAALFVFPI